MRGNQLFFVIAEPHSSTFDFFERSTWDATWERVPTSATLLEKAANLQRQD
jgi:hypothetical protein